MKTTILIIALVVISFATSFSQITNLHLAEDSTVVIDRLYAGSLSGTTFSDKALTTSSFTCLRIGAMGSYNPTNWLSVKGYGMIQMEAGADPWTLQQFWVKLTPTHKLSLELGSMATLVTEQRPHPVSGNGQFETWTESQIPGMAINAKLKYNFTTDFQLAGAVAVRNKKPEYSGRITYKKVQLSGWYTESTQKLGSALSLNFDRVSNTLVWKEDQVISNIFVLTICPKKGILLYADNGYDLSTHEIARCENGFLKTFKNKYFEGLEGIGYDKIKRGISAYFYIHL